MKILFENIYLLVLLLITTNLFSGLFLIVYPQISSFFTINYDGTRGLNRWRLPNYKDKNRAQQIFHEAYTLKLVYSPFVGFRYSVFRGRTITIDKFGDRIHVPAEPLSSAAPEVWFFGGSAMWGIGVDDQNTIPALFNSINPKIETYNFGEVYFNSRQSLARLVSLYAQDRKAAGVIFYVGVNDVGFWCHLGVTVPTHFFESLFTDAIREHVKQSAFDLLYNIFLKQTVRLTRKISKGIFPRRRQSQGGDLCSVDKGSARQVAQTSILQWRMAHDLVTARGGRFIAVLQPIAYLGDARTDHIITDLASRGKLARQYQIVYPLIKEMMADYDYIYDFTHIFDREEYIYIDFAHVSKNGNQIIAEKLSEIWTEVK